MITELSRYNHEAPLFSFDTETELFGPGNMAPRIACFSFGWREGRRLKTHLAGHEEGADIIEEKLEQSIAGNVVIAGHYLPYDVLVCAAQRPKLLEMFFDAYARGGVHCTQSAEWVIDTAHGLLRAQWNEEAGEYKLNKSYSLENLANLHLGAPFYKDEWRMRYGELRGIPVGQWPARAQEYPQQDSGYTLELAENQRERAQMTTPHDPLEACVAHTCRTYLSLALVSAWGEEIDPERVAKLNRAVKQYVSGLLPDLLACRVEGCKKYGQQCSTHSLVLEQLWGKNKGKLTKKKLALQELIAQDLIARGVVDCDVSDIIERPMDVLEDQYLTDGGKSGNRVLKASAEILADCEHPLLQKMDLFLEGEKLRTSFAEPLKKFGAGPLHSRYGWAETGRTTNSGGSKRARTGLNIQQLPRKLPDELVALMLEMYDEIIDVRSCFTAREGYVQSSSDYSALEMCTFAEVLMQLLGWSTLAEAINADKDPHVMLAAEQWLRMSYEDALAAVAAGDENAADMRQLAKVPNFGLPGGMGGKTLVRYAKSNYGSAFVRKFFGATVSEQIRKGYRIKDEWMKTWAETPEYFELMGECVGDGEATIIQLFSNRIHGGCTFSMACNTMFQGLAADGATEALWHVVRECYDPRMRSVLFGSRVTAFVHDEIRAEHPEEVAPEGADRVKEVMEETMQRWTPNVRSKVEPALSRRWYKGAKSVRNKEGVLQIWEPKKKAA